MRDAEIIGIYHGYECRYTPTIMSGPVFRWHIAGSRGLFEVSASRDGVMFYSSSPVFASGELFKLLAVVELARQTSERLERIGSRSVDGIKSFIAEFKG